ncbi:MAG: TlpA family protein disulfide reductase [Bryobacterales bacterium]|nr:TlpA family protein disulfide reductase [Bryobacterales bacterium]
MPTAAHSAAPRRVRRPFCFGAPEFALLALAAVLLAFTGCQKAQDPIAGLWQAQILAEHGPDIAFQIDVTRSGDQVTGALVNGPDREEASSGSFDGKTLTLKFNIYGAELKADLADGKLTGEFIRQRANSQSARKFSATRNVPSYPTTATGPDITGDWILDVGEGDNHRVWSASFKQEGEKLTGTVIPVSGDWGAITGYIRNGEFYLSRFDGIRALLLTGKLDANGVIEGMAGGRKVIGRRAGAASAQGPQPPDPGTYTKMKNPAEPFRFEGIDLDGKPVKSSDPRFQGKVLVVTITGTWCPNCHDEAPVLVSLYNKYKSQGLEVVALAYEASGSQAQDLEKLRLYREQYGIDFLLLLAGATAQGEIERTLPQLENFGAYPTTIYVGRDGKVQYIHAGFESKATGERHQRLVGEMDHRIQTMLAEGKRSTRPWPVISMTSSSKG